MRRTNDFVHRAGWTGRLISPWLTPSDALAGDVAGGLWCPGASYISPVSQQASPHRHGSIAMRRRCLTVRAWWGPATSHCVTLASSPALIPAIWQLAHKISLAAIPCPYHFFFITTLISWYLARLAAPPQLRVQTRHCMPPFCRLRAPPGWPVFLHPQYINRHWQRSLNSE